jgi:hypothetical protein
MSHKPLSITEIERQFPSEWVLVDEPQTDELGQVQDGRVLYHSKDRDEVYRRAVELRPAHFAMLYTGAVPEEGTAIVLWLIDSIPPKAS